MPLMWTAKKKPDKRNTLQQAAGVVDAGLGHIPSNTVDWVNRLTGWDRALKGMGRSGSMYQDAKENYAQAPNELKAMLEKPNPSLGPVGAAVALPFAATKAIKGVGKGAKAKRATSKTRPLMDYSFQDDMPSGNPLNVEAPGYFQPNKFNPRTEELRANKAVTTGIAKSIREGLAGDSRSAGLNFYNPNSMRAEWHNRWDGKGDPDEAFKTYMKTVAGTSSGKPVPPNLAVATHYYAPHIRGKGLPVLEKNATGKRGELVVPKSLSLTSGQTDDVAVRKFLNLDGRTFDKKQAPKMANFYANLVGVDNAVTADRHALWDAIRRTGDKGNPMPSDDWLKSSVRKKNPGGDATGYSSYKPAEELAAGTMTREQIKPSDYLDRPLATEYGSIAEPYHAASKRVGVAPQQGQALAWMNNPAVRSEPETVASAFEKRVRENAAARNMDPNKVMTEVINGRMTLLGGAGAAGGAAALQQAMTPEQKRKAEYDAYLAQFNQSGVY